MNERSGPARTDGRSTWPEAAVLDTNVWLDWLVFEDPGIDPVRAQVRAGRIRLLSLARAREELAEVLARDAVRAQAGAARRRRGLDEDGCDPVRAIARFDALVDLRAAAGPCGLICRDPDDQCFLDLAVAHRARWLLTKDRALLSLARGARRHFGLEILAPLAFAQRTADASPHGAGL